jgi:hypothetical protein
MKVSIIHKSLNGKRVYWKYGRCYGRLAICDEIQEDSDNLHIFICQNEASGYVIPEEFRFGYSYSYVYQISPTWSIRQILDKLTCRLVKKEKFEI